MRKYLILFILLFLTIVPASTYASDLMEQAIRQISMEIAEALPKNPHVRLIAVTQIDKDDGFITRTLTELFQSSSHFHLVERNRLEHIIKEQGFQLSDLVSRDQRVMPGQIRGVEAIVFGEILEQTTGPMSARLRVFLQMNNVGTGDILMAREFNAKAEAPYRDIVHGFLSLGGILAVLGLFFNIRARARLRAKQQAAWKIRKQASEDLKHAAQHLRQMQNALRESGGRPFAEGIEALAFDAGALGDRIQGARWGRGVDKDTSRLAASDKIFAEKASDARRASNQLLKHVREGKAGNAGVQINEIKHILDDLADRISKRN